MKMIVEIEWEDNLNLNLNAEMVANALSEYGCNRTIVAVRELPSKPELGQVSKETHTSCEGCGNHISRSCYGCFIDSSDHRKNYTPKQPAQTEEPRFSVGEIINIVHSILRIYDGLHYDDLCRMIEKELHVAFTERRRG